MLHFRLQEAQLSILTDYLPLRQLTNRHFVSRRNGRRPRPKPASTKHALSGEPDFLMANQGIAAFIDNPKSCPMPPDPLLS